ncbi:hypothetical protein H9636_15940 [Ureibacillus sp. Re31]|uniref:DUF2283 domain-containing protein n=1 Tax=Ureibacillus galli TaxID=2762222 RepID=A0ABR8XFX4_9BACL|nr:hypothetical protein [Ureibacillus galli]MBD8028139.1 hypothetical protein [Ureibacillus galli]
MFKLNVTTHSGESDIVEVDVYDPNELNTQRNDESIQAILIGPNSYSRIDLKNVKLIEEVASEEPIEEINQ